LCTPPGDPCYRWYLGLESGERKYDELEKKIATFPTIVCPTITLEGDANGAAHADPSAYAKKYVGRYEHRNITGGIGHNLPQEAPEAFAQAIVDVNVSIPSSSITPDSGISPGITDLQVLDN
jgi:pimeloyl-ACP methyl ester carboxylesterase